MDDKKESGVFRYTYSAGEHEELRKLRQKYMTAEESKMERLRRMDAAATGKGTRLSVLVGVIGALILGAGMCCCMVWQERWFVPGMILGLLGMAMAVLAHPIYQWAVKKEREKIAPEILRLTDELMK